jgi:hypothetical protein
MNLRILMMETLLKYQDTGWQLNGNLLATKEQIQSEINRRLEMARGSNNRDLYYRYQVLGLL